MSWTEEHCKLLEGYWAEGLSASQIGQLLNRTRNSVIGKAHRAKLPARKVKNPGGGVRAARIRKKREVVPPGITGPSKPPTFVKIQELDAANKGIPIHKLEWIGGQPSNCRAIIGQGNRGALYCGESVSPGQSWCTGHCIQFLNGYTPPKILAAE